MLLHCEAPKHAADMHVMCRCQQPALDAACSGELHRLCLVSARPVSRRLTFFLQVFGAKLLVGDFEKKDSLVAAFQAPGKPVIAFCVSTPSMAGTGFVANAEAEVRAPRPPRAV